MYPPLQPSSTIIHARVIRTEYAICGKAHSKSAPLLSPRLLRLIIKYIKPRIHKGSYSTVQSLSSNDPLCEWVAVICRAWLLQSYIYFKVSLVRVLLMNKFQLALLWFPVSANRATAQHRTYLDMWSIKGAFPFHSFGGGNYYDCAGWWGTSTVFLSP